MIDIEGQVDRFYKKLQVRQTYVEEKKTRAAGEGFPEARRLPNWNWEREPLPHSTRLASRKSASSWPNLPKARQPCWQLKVLAASR